MSLALLRRVSRMSREEIAWRTGVAARRSLQRAAFAIRRPQWPQPYSDIAAAIRRRPGRFVINPEGAGEVRAAVLHRWPAAAADAAERANRIIAGRCDLLGYRGLECGGRGGVNWHRDPVHNRTAPRVFFGRVPYLDASVGDHKIIWELNRHQQWLQLGRALWLTGDTRYRDALLVQLRSWLADNPPLTGINWASMLELGFRAISWTAALHMLLAFEPELGTRDSGFDSRSPDPGSRNRDWLAQMLAALDRQLTHLEQNLSYYFSPNTHLTGEALALYVTGLAIPEFAGSARRVAIGRQILLAEIARQILPDGGHAERSTHYQRYTLDFYLLALITAERNGDEAAPRFRDAVARLAAFTRAMADDQGRLPLIGDDDGGMLWPIAGRECADVRDSLAVAAIVLDRPELAPWEVPEEAVWILGPAKAGPHRTRDQRPETRDQRRGGRLQPARSRTFPDTGYIVLRDDTGSHAVFDVGEHGYMNGGHAHADALALTLTLGNRPVLVDPGTSTYTMDRELRDRLRSSVSHNTVTVDGRSSAVSSGPFHWQTRANGRLHASRHNPAFDWCEGSHDGYAPTQHRRTVVRAERAGWLIVDEILGSGHHSAAAHWHFHPDWALRLDDAGRLQAHAEADQVWVLHDGGATELACGDETTGLGWYAPAYGTLVPAWTARTLREGAAPFAMMTWIGPASGGDRPSLERLEATADAAGAALAARVRDGAYVSTFVVRPGDVDGRDDRDARAGDYATDARAFHHRVGEGRIAVDLADATRATALGDRGLTIESTARVTDLHVALVDGQLDIRASTPPPELSLRGDSIRLVTGVRVNGRELPPAVVESAPLMIVRGADWGEPLFYT